MTDAEQNPPHLVERVAERLLRSGALEESAAHLLDALPLPAAASLAAVSGGLIKPDPKSDSTSVPGQSGLSAAAAEPSSVAGQPDSNPVPSPSLLPVGSPAPTLSPQATILLPTSELESEPASFAASLTVDGDGVGRTSVHHPLTDRVHVSPSIDAVALERGGMVDWSRARSRISEEFRLVQRQILRIAFGNGSEPGFSNLLMVTSARPGEGKSFTSINLAGSIARQGDHSVLLVDTDSKRDSICSSLGLAEARGLLDLVANPKLDPGALIIKTPIERLSILPVGRERTRSAELFSAKEMTRLIQSLGRRYVDRILILDASPCLSTSDPAVLAPVVGQVLFVVEADVTQRTEVEASLDLIQACPIIALVLNKQKISSRYTFGAYSSYYSPS
jgi:protein-tyrosine kinase